MAQLLSEEASPVAEQVSHTGSDNPEVDLGESSRELHLSHRKKGHSLEDIDAQHSLDVMERNGGWQHFVPEILSCISDRLSMPDFIRFRSVCRSWRSAPSFRSNITNFDKGKPWVLIYGLEQKHHDHCILLQLLSHNHCLLKLPVLSGTTVLASMAGWLLCRNGNYLFFYNPFSLQGFQLPKHPLPLEPLTKQEATFSSLPTSPYCIVFIINGKDCSKLEISWCRPFEKSWSVKVVDFGAWLTSEWSCGLYCSCRRFERSSNACTATRLLFGNQAGG
ncbi:hypothetical protein HPP92_013708 [Vanilla planifolia]|uniref:F-box domain-containing protein n=1 Tax=Vanilla planifolia TaxID=51239 RepID=A0A835QY99_VANPL|nr:hypothetical protein HPP92_013708 [Vanilla planifolia]